MQKTTKKVRLVVELEQAKRQKFKIKAMSENPPKNMKEKVEEFIDKYINDGKN